MKKIFFLLFLVPAIAIAKPELPQKWVINSDGYLEPLPSLTLVKIRIPAWTSGIVYAVGDSVDNDGGIYACTAAHGATSGTEPGTGASWESYWRLQTSAAGAESDPDYNGDPAASITDAGSGVVISAAERARVAAAVQNTGDETVNGVKTFGAIPVGPASDPTTGNQLTRKAYVDGLIAALPGYVGDIAADPTANEDTGDGYLVGDIVGVTGTTKAFMCFDVSSGAAVWKQLIFSDTYAQVSSGERTAGTETGLRWFAPADVKSMIDTHASAAATDGDAIHDNEAGEIAALTEKTTPVSADVIIIEDSADTNAKKKVQIGNLPGGSGDVTAASAFGTDNVLIKSDGTGKGTQATGIMVDDSDNVAIPGSVSATTLNLTPSTSPKITLSDEDAPGTEDADKQVSSISGGYVSGNEDLEYGFIALSAWINGTETEILRFDETGYLESSYWPTFNQSTIGSAGSLKSTATTGLMTITGPAAGETRAKTVRDADDTILELGGSYTPTGTWNFSSATMTFPSAVTLDTEWDTWIEHPALTENYFLVGNGSNQPAATSADNARTAMGLGTAATRAAEDTMTDGANLPDGAAIKAYGDSNWVDTPVTLSTGLDSNLLSLSTQEIGLDTQTANYGFFGPTSGGAAAPSFRAMVTADIPDTIVTPAKISDWYDYDILPIAWAADGSNEPAALDDRSTRPPYQYRDFDGAAETENVTFVWFVPPDLDSTTTTINYKVLYLVTNSTGPSNEAVAFTLSGASMGDGDASNASQGSAVTVVDSGITASQWTLLETGWSDAVTVANIAAGETAELAFSRLYDGSNDYAQDVGVVAVKIRYVQNVAK